MPRHPLVTVELSRAMDPRSFTRESFRLELDGEPVVGRVAASGRFASFLSALELSPGRRYVVILDEGVRDAEGRPLGTAHRFDFRTVEKDPFALAGTNPSNGQRNVDIDQQLTATFSEPLDPSSLDSSTFVITGPGGQHPAQVTARGSTLFLAPAGLLAESTRYRGRISASLRSAEGEELGSEVDFEFETGRYLQVLEVSPRPNSEDVDRRPTVRATFSRPLDPTTVDEAAFILLDAGGAAVPGEVSSEGRLAFFEPADRLDSESEYTARLENTIRSAAGPGLEEAFEWSFRTREQQVPPMLFAYVSSSSGGNRLVGFDRGPDGSLLGNGTVYESGGTGTSLFWVNALTLSRDGLYLFAANMASDDISSLRIESDGRLTAVTGSPFPSGGQNPAPMVASWDGQRLYVGEPDTQTISIFDVGTDGSLTLRPPMSFSVAGRPFGMDVSHDGGYLFLVYAGSPTDVEVLEIRPDGSLVSIQTLPSGNSGGVGVIVAPDDRFVYSGDWGDTGIYAYGVPSWQPVPGSPFPNAKDSFDPVDSVLSPNGQFLYYVNRNADNVSGFSMGPEGALTHLPLSPYAVGAQSPNVATVSDDGFLYTGNADSFSLSAFRIGADGSLSEVHPPKKLPIKGSYVVGIAVTQE